MTLRTLNYGNYGIFLIMGHAGFCPSTVRIGFLKGFVTGVQICSLGNANLAGSRENLRGGGGGVVFNDWNRARLCRHSVMSLYISLQVDAGIDQYPVAQAESVGNPSTHVNVVT